MNKWSLRDMLKTAKESTGMSFEAIGQAAGLKDVKKDQAVYTALTRNQNISFALADWIINNTFGGLTPLDQARNAIAMMGLDRAQADLIEGVIKQCLTVQELKKQGEK